MGGGAVVWTRGSENTKIAKSRQDLKEGGREKKTRRGQVVSLRNKRK